MVTDVLERAAVYRQEKLPNCSFLAAKMFLELIVGSELTPKISSTKSDETVCISLEGNECSLLIKGICGELGSITKSEGKTTEKKGHQINVTFYEKKLSEMGLILILSYLLHQLERSPDFITLKVIIPKTSKKSERSRLM